MSKNSAHWFRHTHLFSADEYKCSVCGKIVDKPNPICPKCGASMGGEKYDPSWIDEAAFWNIIDGE